MKRAWIVWLFAACVVRVSSPFRLPPPGPDTEPAAAGPPPPPNIPHAERRSAADERARQVAQDYDQLLDELARADQEASAHQDDDAEARYRRAVEAADQLLDDLAGPAAPAAVYPTRSDGPLDHAALIAKLRDARARADRLGKAAHGRVLAALDAELHARTPQQRAVVADHGRPDEVRRRRQQTCWIYRGADTEETFCWTAAGRLARHNRSATATASSEPAPDDRRAPPAPEAKRPKRLSVQAYYAAATFAAGDCSFSDCFKSGWTTRLPDGESASTSCDFSDCGKSGWTTRFPDGDSASTSCDFSDCFKSGWTTRLPDGTSISCSCDFSDCTTHGASCH